ncbi:hypothetical protein [Azospirillum sp. B2RO_4]|uniref:hypothetical protein n=1 Tax=Azospirillum sp. B2RO_4 TaxID=3027796 RepID=UPI003DA7CC74
MDYRQRMRAIVLRVIAEDTNIEFWQKLKQSAIAIYPDSFETSANDVRVMPTRARFRIQDDRHTFMDKAMFDAATASGMLPVDELNRQNRWRYTFIRSGRITMTQKRIKDEDAMATPSSFRRLLALPNELARQMTLGLPGDVNAITPSYLNGVIVHGPIDPAASSEGFKRLGFIKFAVPDRHFTEWAATLGVDEIIVEMQNQAKRASRGGKSDRRTPTWKPNEKRDEDKKEP